MLVTVPDDSGFPLSIRLFGPFEVCLSGQPLPRLRSRKGQWLLALLALRAGSRRPQSGGIERAWLVGRLWPDSPEAAGFTNLRSSLKDLRHALGSEAHRLRSPTPRTLCLDLTGADVDVLAFDAAIARGDEAALEQAVALYRGPLLESCAEDWAFQERQPREQAVLAALETLAAKALARGEAAAAERYLRRAVALDPLRESAQRALMRTLAAGGNHAAAALAYRDLRLRLHRDINSAPDPETHALYEQIRVEGRRMGSHPAGEAGRRIAEGPVAPVANAPGRIAPRTTARRLSASTPGLYRHTLPVPRTPLVGRAQELQALTQLIRNEEVGLVTLTGPGGSGKTRLAQQVAAGLHHEFEDGVLFVPLASLADPDLVAPTIAVALGAREESSQPPVDLLKARLWEKQLLLLLDNFEHLVAAAPLVAELLEAAPGLKVLATSRAALHLRGEKEFYVLPLTLPPKAVMEALRAESHAKAPSSDSSTLSFQPSALLHYAAVELFVQRARDAKPEFALTHENATAVAEICCRLDGLPLAIELAAARTRVLPPQALLARLVGAPLDGAGGRPSTRCAGTRSPLRLLTSGARDLPARQQTLRDTIAWSYDLLPEAEKQLFRRLAVFAGGCTLETVEAVCNADGNLESDPLDGLEALVGHSLVRQEGGDAEPRFTMLETIREYARERLHDSSEAEAIQEHHVRFYLQMLESAAPHLQRWTAEERLWIDRLEHDHGNLRSALDVAELRGEIETAVGMAATLWRFWYVRGYWSEAQERLNRLLELTARPERAAQRARLLSALAQLAYWQADSARARELAEQSLALRRDLGDQREIAAMLTTVSAIAMRQEDYTVCQALLKEQISIWLEQNNQPAAADSLWRLALIAHRGGNEAGERSFWEEGLVIQRQIGNQKGVAVCLQCLGAMAFRQGDTERAWALYEQSLQIWRDLNDKDRMAFLLCEWEKFAHRQGRREAARRVHLELLEVTGQLAEERSVRAAAILSDIGATFTMLGDHLSARDLFATSLAIAREVDYKGGITWQLANLAETAIRLSDWSAARAFLEEALPLARENGKRLVVARILQDLGTVAYLEGRYEEPARLYRGAIALASTEGLDSINRSILLFCLEGQARLAVTERRWQQGALLFGAAEALRQHLGEDRFFADLVDSAPHIRALRHELSEEVFKAAWIQGQEMPLERVLQWAQDPPDSASNSGS